MRFWLGLAVGLVAGVAIGWLATARPWRGAPVAETSVEADAGAQTTRPQKRKGRRKSRGEVVEGEAHGQAPDIPASGRVMAWRGPDISLPERDVDLGAGDTSRPLDSDEINGVLERSSDPVLACIRESLAGGVLQGKVQLRMLVTGDGKVSQVRVGAPRWLLDHGFADCASSAARRLRFPATGAPTLVDAPYHID